MDKYQWLLDNAAKWSWNPSNAYKNVSGFAHKGTGYAGYALDEAVCLAMDKDAAQPAQGWKLREVYFDEHGEPIMHREPAQEPMAWIVEFENGEQELHFDAQSVGETQTPLYTAQPQRPWVGLTQEQFTEAARLAEDGNYLVAFQRIQQWLKEKNT